MKTSTTEPASPDRAADTRERLLLAGLTLFSQLGLEGVRTRQLSEAAGVNQSAIPYHFGGKEGVYAAVLEQTAQDIAARLDLPDAPPATARVAATQLEALMRGFATALLDSEASARAACCWRANSCNPRRSSRRSTPACSCPCTKP